MYAHRSVTIAQSHAFTFHTQLRSDVLELLRITDELARRHILKEEQYYSACVQDFNI